MPDPNRVMADAEALLQRVSPEGRRLAQRQRQRRNRALMRSLLRTALAVAAIIVAAIAWGVVIGPIGQMGFLAVIVAMAIAAVVIFAMSHEPEETAQSLAASDITLLPQKTEAWLQRQRPALP